MYIKLFKKHITNRELITPLIIHLTHPKYNDEMKPTSVPKEITEQATMRGQWQNSPRGVAKVQRAILEDQPLEEMRSLI